MSQTLYRGFRIEFDPPPIPDRNHDWRWAHEDYAGPGDRRCGTSKSLAAARQEIDELLEELIDRNVISRRVWLQDRPHSGEFEI